VKKLRGPVAVLDKLTEDGRLLEAAGAQIDDVPVPVMATAGVGHDPSLLVGRCVFRLDGDVLRAVGEIVWERDVQVPPGRYACGLDARIFDMERGEDVATIKRWAPMGLTIHLSPTARNAFEVDQLEVYEA
jgi:hypothetical protein